MVSDTLALLGMICCDSGLRAGQRPQRANGLLNTVLNFHTSVLPSIHSFLGSGPEGVNDL